MAREYDPIRGEFPNPKEVKCKDCLSRLKIKVGDKDIGAINAYCNTYTKQNSNGKPIGILFKKEDCKYYIKDPSCK